MSTNAPPPIFKDILNTLEADIIFGRLRPHQELIEDSLMERFNAKRHIVRAVIQELVSRHIVVKPRSRSARVKDFTMQEVNELYEMRALLQREAIHIMPLPATACALDELKQIHAKYEEAIHGHSDPWVIHTLNDQFHLCLFSLCNNNTLCKAITFYTEATNPIRSYGITDPAWLSQALDEHASMIAAIESQDRATLATLVVSHIQPTKMRWEALRRHN